MRRKKTIRKDSWTRRVAGWHPQTRQLVNILVTVASLLLCLLLLPTRFPGMTLLGIGPNWLLIWVVSWSVKRNMFQGLVAGVALGLVQDAMTSPQPTHTLSLALVGVLTARLQKQRFIQEDFISVALIVFGMAVIAETVMAVQYSFFANRTLGDIWELHQLIGLSSAILSSLWAPVIYFPLNLWWERIASIESA